MASFVLSANPNVNFDPTTDLLQIDTGAASSVKIFQQGSDVIVTNGTNTATLQNVVLAQLAGADSGGVVNITAVGSNVHVGDSTVAVIADDTGTAVNGTAGGDFLMGLGGADTIDGAAG